MEVLVLGSLRVVVSGHERILERLKERAVLSALAMRAGSPVSVDELVDALWLDAPPRTAGKTLQNHVLRLRRTLGADHIVTSPRGYCLDIAPQAVDAHRFESAVQAAARSEMPAAAVSETVSHALREWRGAPYPDLAGWPVADAEARRFEEMRLVAEEIHAGAEVERGRHALAVIELEAMVDREPLRERRWELLMLALYQAGRQTDALKAFQRARKTLTVEFGLEPGPELVALERAILDHDVRLGTHDRAINVVGSRTTVECQHHARALFDRGERLEAIALLEQAVNTARERGGDRHSISEASIDLAEYARARGDWPRASAAINDAVQLARDLDEPGLLARAALVASGDGMLAGLDPVGPPVALLREALDRLPPAPTPLRARLFGRLAVVESHNSPLEIAAHDSDESMRLAPMFADPETLAIALHSRLVVDQDLAHLDDRRACGLAILELARKADQPRWRTWTLPALARVEAMSGACDVADSYFAELTELSEELDDPVARYHACYGDVLRTTLRSDYPAALHAIERARDAGERAFPEPGAAGFAYFGSLGILQLLEDAVPDAFAPIETSFPQATMDATFRAWFAVVSARRGDTDAARAQISHLDRDTLVALPRDAYWPSLVWLLSVAFAAVADRERAEIMYELALPFVDTVVVDLGATFLGAMAHHVGVLATTFGADTAARQHFCMARDVHERIGATKWAATSELALARVSAP